MNSIGITVPQKSSRQLENMSDIQTRTSNDIILGINNLFGKKIIKCKPLTGGLTNKVYLVELEGGEKVVIKIGEELSREKEYFWFISNSGISIFPKLLEIRNGGKILIFEFKEGINGKEIVELIEKNNWEIIGEQLGKTLKNLHGIQKTLTKEEEQESINKMIDYLTVETKIFKQSDYDNELKKLKELIERSTRKFVILHGDFSPHNCLFQKDANNNYSISTILDPSARVGYGISYFDIVYLFNTRWNKNKSQLIKGFLEQYDIDQKNPLFLQFQKVMRMYLAEIYLSMGDKTSAKNILNDLDKNIDL